MKRRTLRISAIHHKLLLPIESNVSAYRSLPLIRPCILYTTSSPKWGRGVFSKLFLTIRPLKNFATYTNYYDTAKVHVPSYKSTCTNDCQCCLWSSCVVFYIGKKSYHFNARARTFTTTSLQPSSRTAIMSVMYHWTFPTEVWPRDDLYR